MPLRFGCCSLCIGADLFTAHRSMRFEHCQNNHSSLVHPIDDPVSLENDFTNGRCAEFGNDASAFRLYAKRFIFPNECIDEFRCSAWMIGGDEFLNLAEPVERFRGPPETGPRHAPRRRFSSFLTSSVVIVPSASDSSTPRNTDSRNRRA